MINPWLEKSKERKEREEQKKREEENKKINEWYEEMAEIWAGAGFCQSIYFNK